jgi:hypothetical protein
VSRLVDSTAVHFHHGPLEEALLLGDGTADSGASVPCSSCGQPNEAVLAAGSGSRQEDVEDCRVCCNPGRLRVRYHDDGAAAVEVESLNA